MIQGHTLLPGTLPYSSWELIIKALEFYLTTEEQRLINENEGDTAWTRLGEYEGVRNDILYYVIGVNDESRTIN